MSMTTRIGIAIRSAPLALPAPEATPPNRLSYQGVLRNVPTRHSTGATTCWSGRGEEATMRSAVLLSILATGFGLVGPIAHAQVSASYKLEEHVFNAGGNPANGAVLQSASYRIRLDAIGDSVLGTGLSSASFHMTAGFVGAYPPPGEVQDLRFTGKTGLEWDPEKSAGVYDLYRSPLSALPGDYGACLQANLASASTSDPDTPAAGNTFFYLVTAENLLGEEGTRGYQSGGAERIGTPCP